MKTTYYVMTKTGANPPRYEHHTIESAAKEAKRLHEAHGKTEVLILEVVARITEVEVPVTRKETKVEFNERLEKEMEEDLPF